MESGRGSVDLWKNIVDRSIICCDLWKSVSFIYINMFDELNSFWEGYIFHGHNFLYFLRLNPLRAVSVRRNLTAFTIEACQIRCVGRWTQYGVVVDFGAMWTPEFTTTKSSCMTKSETVRALNRRSNTERNLDTYFANQNIVL